MRLDDRQKQRPRNRRVHLGEENFPLDRFLLHRLVEAGEREHGLPGHSGSSVPRSGGISS